MRPDRALLIFGSSIAAHPGGRRTQAGAAPTHHPGVGSGSLPCGRPCRRKRLGVSEAIPAARRCLKTQIASIEVICRPDLPASGRSVRRTHVLGTAPSRRPRRSRVNTRSQEALRQRPRRSFRARDAAMGEALRRRPGRSFEISAPTHRAKRSVPLPLGEAAEGDEADERDDDAEPERAEDRDQDAGDDQDAAEADAAEAATV